MVEKNDSQKWTRGPELEDVGAASLADSRDGGGSFILSMVDSLLGLTGVIWVI